MSRYRGPKDPEQQQPCVFRIDLSEEDKRHLVELAADRGVSMAGWMRMAIKDAYSALRDRRRADKEQNGHG